MKTILISIFALLILAPILSYSQSRVLKGPQPNTNELMMFQIQLNPSDTIFNSVDFTYLPVKGFPFFTANSSVNYYTIQQRDSIIKRIDELFFEH